MVDTRWSLVPWVISAKEQEKVQFTATGHRVLTRRAKEGRESPPLFTDFNFPIFVLTCPNSGVETGDGLFYERVT